MSDQVLNLRRQLMRASNAYAAANEELPEPDVGLTMASNYAYVMAGALKHVQRAHGQRAAEDLAHFIESCLTDGDFDDVNGDIIAETM